MDFRLEDNYRQLDDIDYHNNVPWDDVIIRYDNNPSDIRGRDQGIGFGTWCMNQLFHLWIRYDRCSLLT